MILSFNVHLYNNTQYQNSPRKHVSSFHHLRPLQEWWRSNNDIPQSISQHVLWKTTRLEFTQER
jgi:hypothetical protein